MKNIFEIVVGFLVLFIAITFSYIVYQSSDHQLDKNDQYIINAIFDNIDGIKLGSEVKSKWRSYWKSYFSTFRL